MVCSGPGMLHVYTPATSVNVESTGARLHIGSRRQLHAADATAILDGIIVIYRNPSWFACPCKVSIRTTRNTVEYCPMADCPFMSSPSSCCCLLDQRRRN